MNTHISIREMAIADYGDTMAVWQSVDGMGLGPSDSRANIARYLARNPGMSFIASDGRDLVGAVLCGTDGRRGYISHLAVRPSHRKLGVGKALVDCCLAALRAIDIPRCNIAIPANNAAAMAFWRKLGWRFWEERGVRAMSFDIGGGNEPAPLRGLAGCTDWQEWVERFDRMQDRYLIARRERFDIIVRAIRAVRPSPRRILDLGCGTGSLSESILQAFPDCQLTGVDLDETLLALARRRLSRFGQPVNLICDDLRTERWMQSAGGEFDAAVSATALHWLSAENLAELYRRLAAVLKPGGLFINADHAASECPAIQAAWQAEKTRQLAAENRNDADTWPELWQAYAAAIGADLNTMGSNVVGKWEGVEDGMPLGWHVDRLRESGFSSPECFWRCHGDAIYGAVL